MRLLYGAHIFKLFSLAIINNDEQNMKSEDWMGWFQEDNKIEMVFVCKVEVTFVFLFW